MANTAYITYTDAIEALKVLGHEKFRLADDFQSYINALVDACDRIEAIPSADVVEAKHGKWEVLESFSDPLDDSHKDRCRCTNCGFIHVFTDFYYWQYNFCPECGAKMDGT